MTIGAWSVNRNPVNCNILEISDVNEYGEGFALILNADKFKAETSLISAAPDLLEVCETLAKRAHEWVDEVTCEQGLYEQLMDAIAKAKGEPQ